MCALKRICTQAYACIYIIMYTQKIAMLKSL